MKITPARDPKQIFCSKISLKNLSRDLQETFRRPDTVNRLSGSSQDALRELLVDSQETLKLSGGSQEAPRKISAGSQEALRRSLETLRTLMKLSGDFQEALRKSQETLRRLTHENCNFAEVKHHFGKIRDLAHKRKW